MAIVPIDLTGRGRPSVFLRKKPTFGHEDILRRRKVLGGGFPRPIKTDPPVKKPREKTEIELYLERIGYGDK